MPGRLLALAFRYGLRLPLGGTRRNQATAPKAKGHATRAGAPFSPARVLSYRRSQREAAALVGFAYCVFRMSALNACTQA